MTIELVSFSYRHPPRLAAKDRLKALVIDARTWGNPHKYPALRLLTGRDARVAEAIRSLTKDFDARYLKLCQRVSDHHGVVYIGCAGGRHRSVFLAESLGRLFGVPIRHLGITQEPNKEPNP